MNARFEVTVSKSASMIYVFSTLAEAIKFCEKTDGTIKNEFGTVLVRGSWDK